MCGLVGIILPPQANFPEKNFLNALKSLNHRGPDDYGLEKFNAAFHTLFFGHKRLSIIDLTSAASQPMESNDQKYIIVFNGEIYNYKELLVEIQKIRPGFYSNSDTSVLLEAWSLWGKHCISKLKGMFAFAVYDKKKQEVYLVRDAFGIKPIYYEYNNGIFSFASELKAFKYLSKHELKISQKAAVKYLVKGIYEDGSNTFMEGIHQIPPGSLIKISLQSRSVCIDREQWWNPSVAESEINFGDAVEEFRSLFLENIKLHLRSDVPIGAALSGGLDSSALVAGIRYLEPNINLETFSYIDQDKSEENWVNIMIDEYQLRSHKSYSGMKPLSLEEVDKILLLQESPFMSSSILAGYKVFELAKSNSIKVMVEGQGADELLGGYSGFPGEIVYSHIQNYRFYDAIKFINRWSNNPDRKSYYALLASVNKLLPTEMQKVIDNIRVNKNFQLINPDAINPLKNDLFPQFISLSDLRGRNLPSRMKALCQHYGLPSLLRHSDRNSMFFSIESRVPFLTHDLAEFLFRLPENFIVSNDGLTKRILREGLKGILHDRIRLRGDKIGFQSNDNRILEKYSNRKAELLDYLNNFDYLSQDYARYVLTHNLPNISWRLFNFARWSMLNGYK